MDQAMFLGLRATGQDAVMQVVWIYEHPVDLDALGPFLDNLGHHGFFGRLIERSPLPFGRHRWVSSQGPPALDIAHCARPREELSDWADERAQLPIDPEWGPACHLAVLPLTDGSTAVSVVGSHCLADGVGALLAVFEAITGSTRDLGYPPPHTRTRLRAMLSDARQTACDAPETARMLVAAAKLAFGRRHELARSEAPGSTAVLADGDRHVMVPVVTVFIDLDIWDARAEALGGNSYSLVAGFAAKLSERMGRLRAHDGAATLIIPINERTLDDSRANVVSLATVSIDPTEVTKDLSSARVAIRQSRRTAREAPDQTLQLLPLIPFIPKRSVKRIADIAFGFSADLPVSCSNFGDIPEEIGRLDGTDAKYIILRGVDRHVTRQVLQQRCGILNVVSGRIGGKLSITVGAYQPGEENSKPHLRELVLRTLAEFGLSDVIEAVGGG